MQPAFLFDDFRAALSPLTDTRPAFLVRTGALTSFERLRRVLKLNIVGVQVPSTLESLVRESMTTPVNTPVPIDVGPGVLYINARCSLAFDEIRTLAPGECVVESGSGDVVAAMGTPADSRTLLQGQRPSWKPVAELPAPALLARPWHVKSFRDRCLAFDLALYRTLISLTDLPGVQIISGPSRKGFPLAGNQSPTILPTATVYPTATFDIERGPVVVDEHAVIRPHALIIGPAYIGPHSTVLDKALIKPGTAIGPYCKVAGEVGGTIFQGFANKAHDGHLGDSYIGEWANLGAGTTNSNLLNTYANVVSRAQPGGSNERTGEQFLGAIVGDHVRLAIGTRIMTGAVIHTGTMWAATAPISGCVPGFSWVTDAGQKPYRFEKFREVAHTAMARRSVSPSAAYEARLRQLAGE